MLKLQYQSSGNHCKHALFLASADCFSGKKSRGVGAVQLSIYMSLHSSVTSSDTNYIVRAFVIR